MSFERYEELVTDLCEAVGLPDATTALERGCIEVEGYEVLLSHYDSDPSAMYLNFHFGIVTAGRTLHIYRLLLEANLTVYAQDQAQAGVNPDTGGIVLIMRVPMGDEVNGAWLAETMTHYAEHGRYWSENMVSSSEEMFEGICSGDYQWLRA